MQPVLLIHGGAVGDFVMTLRIVAGLRNNGVQSVTVLGRPSIARLGMLGGGVDHVLDLDAGGYHALFARDAKLPNRARQAIAHIDTVIDMLGDGNVPLPKHMHELGVHRVVQIDPRPRDDWHEHVTDQWLSDLRGVGIDLCADAPRLVIDEATRKQARTQLAWPESNATKPRIILHPGSGGRHKRWPLASFVALNAQLQQAGCKTCFLLGPIEAECMQREEIERLRASAPLLMGLSLEQVAASLSCANVFVGNDSGISHLAAAVGTRTAAIFGPTDPRLWRPLGPHVTVLRSPSPNGWPDVAEVLDALLS